jgi:lipoprotein-releasing system permease protein
VNRFALFVGFRYSFSPKRNRFTSVIAMVSMLGMVLGVASLITVLAVMNGFAGELRGRILSLVAHGYVEPAAAASAPGLRDWEILQAEIESRPDVVAVSPYLSDKVIVGSNRLQRGAVLTAIDPGREVAVSDIPAAMISGRLSDLETASFNVVMGAALARMLGVGVGDRVEVTVPRLTVTPLGVFPRSKRLTVSGLFEVGAQPDSYQLYVSLATGQKLLGQEGYVDGLQVKTRDLFQAPRIMTALGKALPAGTSVKDWSQTQGSLFRAVKMEKVMVSLL